MQKSRPITEEIEVRRNFRPCEISRNGLLQIAAEFIPAVKIGRCAKRGLGDADEQPDERNAFVWDGVEIGDFRSAAKEFVEADERVMPGEPADGNPRVGDEIEVSHGSVIRTSHRRDRGLR